MQIAAEALHCWSAALPVLQSGSVSMVSQRQAGKRGQHQSRSHLQVVW